MGGYPDWFVITNLEVLNPGALSGSPMKDVIGLGGAPALMRAFDLLVTFEARQTNVNWFGGAEWLSAGGGGGGGGPINANADFHCESIGPGPELIIGSASVPLAVGGTPGGSSTLNTSLYQARLTVADANLVFLDSAGTQVPGLYRIGCAVNVTTPVPQYADAYYQQDLVIRVVAQP